MQEQFKPDITKEVAKLVTLSSVKFRTHPTANYLGNVTNLIVSYAEKMEFHPQRVEWVTKLVERFPRDFDIYPSLKEIEALCKEVKVVKPQGPKSEPWVQHIRGVPASIEAICRIIDAGGEMKGLAWGMKVCAMGFPDRKLDDKRVWDIYEAWQRGEAHESLKSYIDPNLHQIANMLSGKDRGYALPRTA